VVSIRLTPNRAFGCFHVLWWTTPVSYRRQELQTQLGLDKHREALRELERERKGLLKRFGLVEVA
jgi:hypothetical protein